MPASAASASACLSAVLARPVQRERLVGRGHQVDGRGLQQRPHGRVRRLGSGHGEHLERIGERDGHRQGVFPCGSSAVSSQYDVNTFINRTSARKVTGLTMYVFAPAS
jgi:hypothetical protein